MRAIGKLKPNAFDELYERYSERIFRYFLRMLSKNEDIANDFTQEIFLKVIESPNAYDSSRNFSTWFFSVAHNMCKNEYRKQSVRGNMVRLDPHHEDIARLEPGFENYDKEVFKHHLNRLLSQMDPEHKEVFILKIQEEMSIKEISVVMNCPEGTVKSRLHYTIKKLTAELSMFDPFKKKLNYEERNG